VRRKRGIRVFFKRAWNFLKKPFLSRRQRNGEGSLAPEETSDSEDLKRKTKPNSDLQPEDQPGLTTEPFPKPDPAPQEHGAILKQAPASRSSSHSEPEPIPGPSGLQSTKDGGAEPSSGSVAIKCSKSVDVSFITIVS
ncbi:hypothetical protein DNTS_022352, partial [Danionella cerebrum]